MGVSTKFLTGQSPHPDQLSKGAIQHGVGRNIVGTDIWSDLVLDGTPVNGTSGTGAGWAGPGSECIDIGNAGGKHYINTGTLLSPTWTVIGSVT